MHIFPTLHPTIKIRTLRFYQLNELNGNRNIIHWCLNIPNWVNTTYLSVLPSKPLFHCLGHSHLFRWKKFNVQNWPLSVVVCVVLGTWVYYLFALFIYARLLWCTIIIYCVLGSRDVHAKMHWNGKLIEFNVYKLNIIYSAISLSSDKQIVWNGFHSIFLNARECSWYLGNI